MFTKTRNSWMTVCCVFQLVVIFSLATYPATAQDASKATLKIGDPVPKLAGLKWLQGEAIEEFREGQVYVIDFWATWCGPCIKAMPHMDELTEKFKDKGLVAIAVTTADSSNPADRITDFVEKQAKDWNIRFAMAENDAMDQAFMGSANQQAIPCSFVVDQRGKLAFIGLPGELDIVLEKIFDGTWKGQETIDAMKSLEMRIAQLGDLIDSEPAKVLEELAVIEKEYPHVATSPQFVFIRIGSLITSGKPEELKTFFDAVVTRPTKSKNAPELATLAGFILSPDINPQKFCVAEGEAAIKTALTWDPKDVNTIVSVATAYAMARQMEKYNSLMDQAIEASEGDEAKTRLQMLKQMLGSSFGALPSEEK